MGEVQNDQYWRLTLKWIEGHHQNGISVTTKMIHTHALNIGHDYNIEEFKGTAT
jgi:hypothetical protein